MNFKKIAITAAAAGVMLASAMPAFAHHWSSDDLDLDIDNDAWVTNRVLTVANTGFNQVNGGGYDDGWVDGESLGGGHHGGVIFTGNATAVGVVSNDVNTNIIDLCGCLGDFDDVDIDIDNDAHVTNGVLTVANTGFNQVNGGGFIGTGDAGAMSAVENVVNTNVVGDAL